MTAARSPQGDAPILAELETALRGVPDLCIERHHGPASHERCLKAPDIPGMARAVLAVVERLATPPASVSAEWPADMARAVQAFLGRLSPEDRQTFNVLVRIARGSAAEPTDVQALQARIGELERREQYIAATLAIRDKELTQIRAAASEVVKAWEALANCHPDYADGTYHWLFMDIKKLRSVLAPPPSSPGGNVMYCIGCNDVHGSQEPCSRYDQTRIKALEKAIAGHLAARDRLYGAIVWALGTGDEFPPRKDGEGPYWWRTELARRAWLEWDGERYRAVTRAAHAEGVHRRKP